MFPHTSHFAQEVSSVRLFAPHASDSHPRGEWPLHTFMELGALPGAVPCARLHTRHVLWEWALNPLIDTAELVVSELVTNALNASEGLTTSRYDGRLTSGTPPIRLWLLSDGTQVVIHVWDGNDLVPDPQEPDPEDEGGRGLLLVTHLCAAWGTYRLDHASGKVTWAATTPETIESVVA